MTIYLKYIAILTIACLILSASKNHTTPIKCIGNVFPIRIFGIAIRDLSATIIAGGLTGYFLEKKPIKGIGIFLLSTPIIHVLFSVRTMGNYYLGLSSKPNGTGFIPNCIKPN